MRNLNQQSIKEANLKRTYNCIAKFDGISRVQLSKMMQLSKTTVSSLVDELISKKYIFDSGTVDSGNVGRNPNSLHLRKDSHFAICINWEADSVTTYLTGLDGSFLRSVRFMNRKKDNCYLKLSLKGIHHLTDRQGIRNLVEFICIIIPGMINLGSGSIYTTQLYMAEEDQKNILPKLKKALAPYPLAFFNDTACYAYAEKISDPTPVDDFVVFNFANGIGATLFIRGQMIGQASGTFTQVGQVCINVPSYSKNKIFLENYIGEEALTERIKKYPQSTSLRVLKKVTYSDIEKARLNGDQVAFELWDSIVNEFTDVLANIITFVGVKLVILGGRSRELGPDFPNAIHNRLENNGYSRMTQHVKIRYSNLQSDSFVTGAVQYYMSEYYIITSEGKIKQDTST